MSVKRRIQTPKEKKINGAPYQNGHAQQNGHAVTPEKTEIQPAQNDSSVTATDIIKIYLPMLGLIFGGCCSNVYALEALVKTSSSVGNIITALQFLLTSVLTLPANVSIRSPASWRNFFLRKRQIPLRSWIIYTAFFVTINILNNMAFSYRISVPLHIILRSAGPVTTMLVFYFCSGRRYPPIKIFAVLLLFLGVVVAAVSDAYSKTPEAFEATLSTKETEPPSSRLPLSYLPSGGALCDQAPGFALLASALLLSAFMGLYSDGLFARYGRSAAIASESLFYSHALPLPFFALQLPGLSSSFITLAQNSAPLSTTLLAGPGTKLPSFISAIPTAIPLLLLNAVTQYVCISGVNRLSARSSSLTVSIVLNIRKLVSLLLSIWLFGNQLPVGVAIGAALVFLGGGLYAVPTAARNGGEKKKQ